MKKPEECMNIGEIREAINEIDRDIIAGLGRRFAYVKAASKFKNNESEVRADDRVKTMLQQRRALAAQEGLSPDFIEGLYRNIVNYFIDEELKDWKRTIEIRRADLEDLQEILKLQHRAYISEAEIYNDFSIQPLTQDMNDIEKEFEDTVFLKAVTNGIIIGSVRCKAVAGTCYIGKVIVHPDYQNKGIGSQIMKEAERIFDEAERFELFTGQKSEKNIYFYKKNGYKIYKTEEINNKLTLVFMEKRKLS